MRVSWVRLRYTGISGLPEMGCDRMKNCDCRKGLCQSNHSIRVESPTGYELWMLPYLCQFLSSAQQYWGLDPGQPCRLEVQCYICGGQATAAHSSCGSCNLFCQKLVFTCVGNIWLGSASLPLLISPPFSLSLAHLPFFSPSCLAGE